MKVSAKSLLIVTVICPLVVSSIPSMTPAAAEATISTEDDDEVSTPNIWCVDNSQGSDWTNGCSRGENICMDGFPLRSCPCQLRSGKRIYCWLGTCRLYISKINPFYFLLFMNHQLQGCILNGNRKRRLQNHNFITKYKIQSPINNIDGALSG